MPSPKCSEEAKAFFKQVRTVRQSDALSKACDLLKAKFDEVFQGSKTQWNEVDRAHLLVLSVDTFRHLQDFDFLLSAEKMTNQEIKALVFEEVAAKEAFVLLHKARMITMHNFQDFGYLTLNLEAVEKQLGDGLKSFLEQSREACKAYIGMLCLGFNEQTDGEFQVGSGLLQKNLDKAVKLNDEILVAKHGYEKYTPKLKIYQLRVRDFLPTEKFKSISDELLQAHPGGKHALAVLELKCERALEVNVSSARPLIEERAKLAEKIFVEKRAAASLETVVEDNLKNFEYFKCLMLDFHYRCFTAGKTQLFEALRSLLKCQGQTIGENESRNYNLWLFVLKKLVRFYIHRKLEQFLEEIPVFVFHLLQQQKERLEKRKSFFGFEVLLIVKKLLKFIEENPRWGANKEALLTAMNHLQGHYLKIDQSMSEQHGDSYQSYYGIYLEELPSDLSKKKAPELQKLYENLSTTHSSLMASIADGSSTLDRTSAPVDYLENNMCHVLSSLMKADPKYKEVTTALIKEKLKNLTCYWRPVYSITEDSAIAGILMQLDDLKEIAKLFDVNEGVYLRRAYLKRFFRQREVESELRALNDQSYTVEENLDEDDMEAMVRFGEIQDAIAQKLMELRCIVGEIMAEKVSIYGQDTYEVAWLQAMYNRYMLVQCNWTRASEEIQLAKKTIIEDQLIAFTKILDMEPQLLQSLKFSSKFNSQLHFGIIIKFVERIKSLTMEILEYPELYEKANGPNTTLESKNQLKEQEIDFEQVIDEEFPNFAEYAQQFKDLQEEENKFPQLQDQVQLREFYLFGWKVMNEVLKLFMRGDPTRFKEAVKQFDLLKAEGPKYATSPYSRYYIYTKLDYMEVFDVLEPVRDFAERYAK